MKIIIYGDKNQMNISYINHGFYKAFTYLTYDTQHITKNQIKGMTFDEPTLFIVNDKENNINIPRDNKHMYVLINYDEDYFSFVNNKLIVKEYDSTMDLSDMEKIEEYIYKKGNTIVMPWGSILTPPEIIKNLQIFKEFEKRRFRLVLTRKHKMSDIRQLKKKYLYKPIIKLDKEMELLNDAKCSVCIYHNNKVDHKALTHLSCGTNIISNSETTRNFLENKVGDLTSDFIESYQKNQIYYLIENILNNHTFCSRVFHILDYFDL